MGADSGEPTDRLDVEQLRQPVLLLCNRLLQIPALAPQFGSAHPGKLSGRGHHIDRVNVFDVSSRDDLLLFLNNNRDRRLGNQGFRPREWRSLGFS